MTKNAIVTGSTSGIGLGIATELAKAGYNIMLNGFGNSEVISNIKSSLAEHKVRVLYSAADMSKPEQILHMVQEAEQGFGSVDILVNNAGIQYVSQIESFPEDKWDAIIAINLTSAFLSIKHVLAGMKKRNFGRIINIASAHGLVASANKSAYVASKHGLVGLTKVVALENAEHNITCNAICPGWVLTPLVQRQIDNNAARDNITLEQAKINLLSEKQPSLRFVQPEQIGATVAFLASDAASNITGTTISIDGGWTAR
jgi:3-hydroxybutyrate dehydrogenase